MHGSDCLTKPACQLTFVILDAKMQKVTTGCQLTQNITDGTAVQAGSILE